jgi:arsenate reductase
VSHDPATTDVVIYHNPDCGTSRNTLALIRNAGVEPLVVEYLKTPPNRVLLTRLLKRMNLPLRAILREKGTPFVEFGLGDPTVGYEAIWEAIAAHPVLINRPIVVTPWGVQLCRPSEAVLDILPLPQLGAFTKEGGEPVIDVKGRRIAVA